MQEYQPEDERDSPAYKVMRDRLLDLTDTAVKEKLAFYEVETDLSVDPGVLLKFSVPTKTLKMGRAEVLQLTRMLSEAARRLPR